MKEEISITLKNKNDAISKYDDRMIKPELILHLLKKIKFIKRSKPVQIIIYNKCNTDLDIIELIKEGLIREYKNIVKEYKYNNLIQIWLFLLGTFFLIIATLIKKNSIWHEILIIIGWVPIWKMMDLELQEDFRGRRKKHLLLRLLKSEYIIK